MPRARVPNASFVASPHLPILPWLAPSVAAESASSRHGGRTRGPYERGKTGGFADSLRTPPCTRARPTNLLCLPLPPSSPHLRYADIASFVRQQARGYASTPPVPRRVAGRTRQQQTSRRLATFRQRLLALEQKRRAGYLSRQPSTSVHTLLGQGQYRSLGRRLLNLRQWNATRLDLSTAHGARKGRPWLVRAFAALDRKVHWRMKRYTQVVVIQHHRRCPTWSSLFFQRSEQKRLAWLSLDVENKSMYAQRLLVYFLDRRPGRALALIEALADVAHHGAVPPEMLADALGHLAKIHANKLYTKHERWDHAPEALKQEFVATFSRVFRIVLSNHANICSQELLFNIVNLATSHDLQRVFDMLVEARTRLGYDTLLHYAGTFGEAGNFEYALKCLDVMKARHDPVAWQRVVDRQRFRWSCAVILRKSTTKGQNYHETPGIVAALVRLGVKIDVLLYNVVMHNAMEAGDYPTAFKVYNALDGNGLRPDPHTFSILLHGCTMQSNPASFNDFAEYAAEVAKEIKDPWLATDYLYYLYVRHHSSSDPERTLARLWRAYIDLFSATPLVPFVSHGRHQLRNAFEQQNSLPEDRLLEPSSVALFVMLQAEIEAALHVGNQRVLTLYSQFKLLASTASNPALTKLAQKPAIWNAFLLAFCQKHQFASASQLITDMTLRSPQPDLYTWNMFMQAFFKTGQVQAAERVFDIMRARGIDPDQYSYGVLLRGYAKAQLIPRIAETMHHVDPDHQLDPDLLRALARVVDRRKLMLALDHARREKENNPQHRVGGKPKDAPRLHFSPILPGPDKVPDSALVHAPTPPRPHAPYNPETQYRALQTQLGFSPEPSAAQYHVPIPVDPSGAAPGFKSMLPASRTRTGAGKGLPAFELRSVFRPGGGGKGSGVQ